MTFVFNIIKKYIVSQNCLYSILLFLMTDKQNNQNLKSVFMILNISKSNVVISIQIKDQKNRITMNKDIKK